MKTSIRSLTTTLALAAASLLAAASAHAQTVITQLPYTINGSGTYVLNSDLNSSQTTGNLITVNASNVTIDFQGHYIAGPVNNTTQTTNGIFASEQSNVTVRNGTVAFCRIGIYLLGNGSTSTNAVGEQVENMRITYCYYVGVYVLSCPASRIDNCQISQTGFSGTSAAYGVIMGEAANETISNCVISTVTANTAYGILSTSSSCFVRQNFVSNCTFGVYGGKYQDNLTYACTTGISSGTDAGGNN